MDAFTGQCLSNSLWAVARLDLRGDFVTSFTSQCAVKLLDGGAMFELSPQGLANIVWAIARLHQKGQLNQKYAIPLCTAAAEMIANGEEGVISQFEAVELSMTAWAMAKIVSGSKNAS